MIITTLVIRRFLIHSLICFLSWRRGCISELGKPRKRTSCPDLRRSHMPAYGIRDWRKDTYLSDFISRVELTCCDRNWSRSGRRDWHIHSGPWSAGDGTEGFPDRKVWSYCNEMRRTGLTENYKWSNGVYSWLRWHIMDWGFSESEFSSIWHPLKIIFNALHSH